MLEVLGFVAAFLLTMSSVPQCIKTFRTKRVDGLSIGTLQMWFWGVFLMGIYVALTTAQVPLLINYGFNTLIVGYNLYLFYKVR